MPSVRNHSPASAAVSSPRLRPPETAGETDPLAALIEESDRAARLLSRELDDPHYQAALADLAAQSSRAADALYPVIEQAAGSLLSLGGRSR